MNAQEEAADLARNPLPQIVVIDPLSQIVDIDSRIMGLQEQLRDLMAEREETLQYAIKTGQMENDRLRIDKKIKTFRTLNVKRFAEVFPDEYRMAKELELKDLRDKIEKAGEKITLGLVDKLVKPIALAAAPGVITLKETVSYEVVRK